MDLLSYRIQLADLFDIQSSGGGVPSSTTGSGGGSASTNGHRLATSLSVIVYNVYLLILFNITNSPSHLCCPHTHPPQQRPDFPLIIQSDPQLCLSCFFGLLQQQLQQQQLPQRDDYLHRQCRHNHRSHARAQLCVSRVCGVLWSALYQCVPGQDQCPRRAVFVV